MHNERIASGTSASSSHSTCMHAYLLRGGQWLIAIRRPLGTHVLFILDLFDLLCARARIHQRRNRQFISDY
jgi:hypothetical protein